MTWAYDGISGADLIAFYWPDQPVIPLTLSGSSDGEQWRTLDPNSKNLDDDWKNPKRLVKRSSFISKKNLDVTMQFQVRVRARIGPCKCGLGTNGPETNEWDYLQCASEDNQSGCQWTPWSPPSS